VETAVARALLHLIEKEPQQAPIRWCATLLKFRPSQSEQCILEWRRPCQIKVTCY
jgi:hypothetical protein